MGPARIPGSFDESWSDSSEVTFTPPGSDEQMTPEIKTYSVVDKMRGKPASKHSRCLLHEVAQLEDKINRKESRLVQYRSTGPGSSEAMMEQHLEKLYQQLSEVEGRLREQVSTADSPETEKSRHHDSSVSKAPTTQAFKKYAKVPGSTSNIAYVTGKALQPSHKTSSPSSRFLDAMMTSAHSKIRRLHSAAGSRKASSSPLRTLCTSTIPRSSTRPPRVDITSMKSKYTLPSAWSEKPPTSTDRRPKASLPSRRAQRRSPHLPSAPKASSAGSIAP
jgi:hypothetical protein